MKKVIFIFVMAFSFLAANFISSCQKKDEDDSQPEQKHPNYGTGAIKDSRYYLYPTATFPARGDIPQQHTLTFPNSHIPNQLHEGSCVAHSLSAAIMHDIGYAIRKIPYSQWGKVYVSPEFIYNLGKASDDCLKGMYVTRGLEIVQELGVPTIDEMPYSDKDCSTMPNNWQLQRAAKTKIKGFKKVKLTPADFAQAIYSGHTLIVAGPINHAFDNAFYEREVWQDSQTPPYSRHSYCIIGYDFNNQTITGFNSWGDFNNNKGRITISMDMIGKMIDEAYILEPLDYYAPLDSDSNDDDKPLPPTDALSYSPKTIDFGSVSKGELSETSLTLTANQELVVNNLYLDNSDFNVQSFSFTLKKDQSRNIVLRCKSNRLGASSANLEISYRLNGEAKTLNIPIKANIIEKNTPPQPKNERIQLDHTQLYFYNVTVGEEITNYLNFTLLEGNATKVDIKVLGDENTFRTLKTIYLNSVGDKRTVGVIYSPKSAGNHRATVLLESPNGYRQEVALYGQAKQKEPEPEPEPQEDLSIPSYLDFGSIEVGQKSIRELRVTNNGKKSALITMYFEENGQAYGAEDLYSNNFTLGAYETKTIKLSFSPRREGTIQGVFRLTSNGGTVARVQLSGRAQEPYRPQQPEYTVQRVFSNRNFKDYCSKYENVAGVIALDAEVEGNYISLKVSKRDGTHIARSGIAYVKENDFCSPVISQQEYRDGLREINIRARNTLRVGEQRVYYVLLVSSTTDTNRFYEQIIIKRNR